MNLDEKINYIISGLERSGTSMLMQIIDSAEIKTAFDNSRTPDSNNPKGYFELEGGKIINKLMKSSFPFDSFKGQFVKITAFGIQFLPPGRYKIIYSERNIEEILDSMEKMIGKKDLSREETRESFVKLNSLIKNKMEEREDIDVLYVNYNNILENPRENLQKIKDFLDLPDDKLEKMVNAVDNRLYRQRRV